MCQDGNSTRDGDNSDESSDEEIFRLVLEDDDNDFMNGMLPYAIHHAIAAIGLREGNQC